MELDPAERARQPFQPRPGLRAVLRTGLSLGLLPAVLVAVAMPASVAVDPSVLVVSHGTADSDSPSLSPDGSRVAFASASPLAAGDANAAADVYLATAGSGGTAFTGTPELVSATPEGAAGAGASGAPAVSADGHYVAFVSSADDLVEGDTNGVADVFVRNTLLDTTVRVAGAGQPDGPSGQPALSGDGRYVAFTSAATNLVAADTNGVRDVFVADLAADPVAVRRVSRSAADGQLPGPSYDPAISASGEHLSFTTENVDVGSAVPSATPGQTYAWRVRREGDDLRPVGRNAPGDQTGQTSLSADGVVAYVSSQTEHHGVPLGDAVPRVFVDSYGHWEWVSDALGDAAVSDPAISADGATVAFTATSGSDTAVHVARTDTGYGTDVPGAADGIAAPQAGPAGSSEPALSASGRSVALSSRTALDAADLDEATDVAVVVLPGVGEVSLHPAIDRLEGLPVPRPISRLHPEDVPATALDAAGGALAGIGVKNIGVKNIGVKNIGVKNIGVKNIWVKNIGVKNIWVKNIGVKNIGVKNIAALLVGTPFEDVPIETVTFGQVMEWALANPDHPSARTILGLTLGDLDEDGVLSRISFTSLLLLAVPIESLALPGPHDTHLANWKAAVAAQGLDPATAAAGTTLLELELLGLELEFTRAHELVARDLPIEGSELTAVRLRDLHLPGTRIGELGLADVPDADRLVDCTRTDCATATFARAAADGALGDATLADLLPLLSDAETLGHVLWTMLPPDAYPWESMLWATSGAARFARPPGETTTASYRASFDTGPGGAAYVRDAALEAVLPPGTAFVDFTIRGTGPHEVVAPFTREGVRHEDRGSRVLFHFGDVPSGSSFHLTLSVTDALTNDQAAPVPATLRSKADPDGDTALITLQRFSGYDDAIDPPANDDADSAPTLEERVIHFGSIHEPDDVDYYRIPAPADGQVVVATVAAAGGDLDTGVFRASAEGGEVGTGGAQGPAALLEEPHKGVGGGRLQPAPENLLAEPGHTLLAGGVHEGTQDEELRVMGDGASAPLLVKVASADGRTSAHPYTVRFRYVAAKPEQRCAPRELPYEGTRSILPPGIRKGTNTIVLIDSEQLGDTYPARNDGLLGLVDAGSWTTGVLNDVDGQFGLRTEIIPVTGLDVANPHAPRNADLLAARSELNADPCNVAKSNRLADEIVELLHSYITPEIRQTLRSVVLVGSDDVIPMHRVRQATFEINEEDNEAALRLARTRDGSPCPDVAAGELDPCATPLSAAAHGNYILTDDAYADFEPTRLLGREVYLPDLGLGRLVETPDEIARAIRTYVDQGGVLQADTALATGYDAWDEMPDEIARGLVGLPTEQLRGAWTGRQLDDAMFPDGRAPRIISPNAHASETHLLPGDPGDGLFDADDLYGPEDMKPGSGAASPEERTEAIRTALAGTLQFTVGCHAGGSLPDVYYGDADSGGAGDRGSLDWSQLLGQVGGYVGNTGFGIADTVATGLSEQLMADYAELVGSGRGLLAGEALSLAKQQYWGDLGRYLGYDDKILMQATYYGMPMYTIADNRTGETVPETTPDLFGADLRATIEPTFTELTAPGGSSYWTTGEEHVTPGLPVLPRVTSSFTVPAGQVVHGAEIVGLTTRTEPGRPAVADARVGAAEPPDRYDAIAFPTSFAHVTGPGRVTLTPGRVVAESPGDLTLGVTELFTRTEVQLLTSTEAADFTAPEVVSAAVPDGRGVRFELRERDPGGEGRVVRASVLHRVPGATQWQLLTLTDPDGDGVLTGAVSGVDEVDAIFQAVDEHNNLRIDTNRGRFVRLGGSAPGFDAGTDAQVAEGDQFVRAVPVVDPDGNQAYTATVDVGSGPVLADVERGADGAWRLLVALAGLAPGTYPVEVEICDDTGLCATDTFRLTVDPGNSAPQASVEIRDVATGEAVDLALPDSVLEAAVATTDADGDEVTVDITWWVNGVEVAKGPRLSVAEHATFDDEVAVTVEPVDEHGLRGGGSSDRVLVVPDTPPTVSLPAGATVAEGTEWTATGQAADVDRQPVTVSVDYGDGSPVATPAVAPDGSFPLAHTYLDDGAYTVTVTATAGTASTQQSTTVTVTNVAPAVTATASELEPAPVGATTTLSVAWSDPGSDSHTVRVVWGDGTSDTATPTIGARSVTLSHVYTAADTYPIDVTVTDDDGGADEVAPYDYAVVFDTGSSVTGNGQYASRAGSWVEQPSATGQAEFGSQAKFDGSTPTGKTRFTFDVNPDDRGCQVASCLQFDSTAYSSLVVSGDLATLRGSGTLLGRTGTFSFLLAMRDGTPDLVRMRITRNRTVVYDSQPDAAETAPPSTPLAGGSILVKTS